MFCGDFSGDIGFANAGIFADEDASEIAEDILGGQGSSGLCLGKDRVIARGGVDESQTIMDEFF